MREENAIIPYEGEVRTDLSIAREPKAVLVEAQRAAEALSDVIGKKKKPVMFNGEQYLEFEDWQTVGRFYGVTAKVIETRPVEFAEVHGFEARAVAISTTTGMEVSAAEAMCLNDEPNWRSKPLFQLRSMAQTRACAKALRNVLAWVVVLAGYKATPAEEMDSVFQGGGNTKPQQRQQPPQAQPPQQSAGGPAISEPQRKRFYAIYKGKGWADEDVQQLLKDHGVTDSKAIPKAHYEGLCKIVENQTFDEYCDLKTNPA